MTGSASATSSAAELAFCRQGAAATRGRKHMHDSRMVRELGDERKRYGRKSFREQLGDAIAWPGSHRFAAGVALVIIAGAVLIAIASGRPEDPRDLAVGDCLYVPTAAALDPTSIRPIGEAADVEPIVVAGGAQKAGCRASHGHEVAAILIGPEPSTRPSGISIAFDRNAIHRLMQPLCEAGFPDYVSHALAGSAFVTFPVVPEASEWIAGGRRTICLVARNDGNWMDHPARGSGE